MNEPPNYPHLKMTTIISSSKSCPTTACNFSHLYHVSSKCLHLYICASSLYHMNISIEHIHLIAQYSKPPMHYDLIATRRRQALPTCLCISGNLAHIMSKNDITRLNLLNWSSTLPCTSMNPIVLILDAHELHTSRSCQEVLIHHTTSLWIAH